MDIDREISQLSPEKIENEIKGYDKQIDDNNKLLKELNVVEPTEFYHEDKHDEVKKEYDIQYKEFVRVETEIKSIQKLQDSVSGGIICEHCGIDLMNAAITSAKLAELDGFRNESTQLGNVLLDLNEKEKGFVITFVVTTKPTHRRLVN